MRCSGKLVIPNWSTRKSDETGEYIEERIGWKTCGTCAGFGTVRNKCTCKQVGKKEVFKPRMCVELISGEHKGEIGQLLGRDKFDGPRQVQWTIRLDKSGNRITAMATALQFPCVQHGKNSPGVLLKQLVVRETHIMRTLAHDNLLKAYDVYFTKPFGTISKKWFLFMDYADTDAEKYFLRPRSPEEIAWFIKEVAETLKYIHSQGVVHRDIATKNILMCQDKQTGRMKIKVADFGLATMKEMPDKKSCGTYTPPEMIRGQPQGPAVDLWALGCELYQLLAGVTMFPKTMLRREVKEKVQDKNMWHHLRKRALESNKNNPKVDEALGAGAERLIGCLLEQDPNERATVEDVLHNEWLNIYAASWINMVCNMCGKRREDGHPKDRACTGVFDWTPELEDAMGKYKSMQTW